MAETKFVTRRVIESTDYQVYKKDGLQLVPLDIINEKGKVSEKELATKYGIDKVFIEKIKENKAIYGVPVDKFMEIATLMPVKESNNESEDK